MRIVHCQRLKDEDEICNFILQNISKGETWVVFFLPPLPKKTKDAVCRKINKGGIFHAQYMKNVNAGNIRVDDVSFF